MDVTAIRAVANAILYEGYMLYPYRPSALKNRSQGWTFGTLVPETYAQAHAGEACDFRGEVLIAGGANATISAEFRFLHLAARDSGADANEREVLLGPATVARLLEEPISTAFAFPTIDCGAEPASAPISGVAQITATRIEDDVTKLTVVLRNRTPIGTCDVRDDALPRSLVSAHAVLTASGADFLSLLDPPEHLRATAEQCRQSGVFPVLAGEEGQRTAMLVSPIILYDYPRVAASSHGEFFDSSEIDEMLTLRVLTLTEDEKREVLAAGARARSILQRTESLSPGDILKLHGIVRGAAGGEK